MKKLSIALFAVAMMFAGQANANTMTDLMRVDLMNSIASEMQNKNLINWEVGEHSEYSIGSSFGNLGNMNKRADREEGNALWVVTEITGMQSQTQEALIDRATGEILEYRVNGQPQEPPSGDLEIIEQNEAQVTVPAGTFNTIHIVAKSDQVQRIEIWVNPREIVMDGAAKIALTAQGFPVTVELLSFGRP